MRTHRQSRRQTGRERKVGRQWEAYPLAIKGAGERRQDTVIQQRIEWPLRVAGHHQIRLVSMHRCRELLKAFRCQRGKIRMHQNDGLRLQLTCQPKQRRLRGRCLRPWRACTFRCGQRVRHEVDVATDSHLVAYRNPGCFSAGIRDGEARATEHTG